MSLSSDLEKKNVGAERIAERVMKDQKLLSEVFQGISSDKARVKYGNAKVLRIIGERNPQVLYPKWDFFADMLDSSNTFLKCDGVFIIGHLTRVDSENKIARLFEKLYKLLNDESMITAASLIGVSAIIAKAKPELQTRITDALLSINQTHHGSECKNVLKGHIISTLDTYFMDLKEREKALDFIRVELRNSRPATKKKAEKFMKKWG
ncbi:MAG: hypothetical protein WED05_09655 [Candidatus Atabeyarchaeum deiterrae]